MGEAGGGPRAYSQRTLNILINVPRGIDRYPSHRDGRAGRGRRRTECTAEKADDAAFRPRRRAAGRAAAAPCAMREDPHQIYATAPNFAELAAFDPKGLAPHLKSNGRTLDWSSPEALRALSSALLRRDFGLDVSLPADRLCPAVPNRLDYLCALDTLLGEACPADPSDVLGIDVGCGASCIYGLLGRRAFGWRFVCSESDRESARIARENVERNGEQGHVRVVHVADGAEDGSAPPGPVSAALRGGALPAAGAAVVMCNPPFFDASSPRSAQSRKRRRTACTASDGEWATAGGEESFVGRMIRDSASARLRASPISWFSAQLGRKASIPPLRDELARAGARDVRVLPIQRGRTRRWVLAWSYGAVLRKSFPCALAMAVAGPRLVEHCRAVKGAAVLGAEADAAARWEVRVAIEGAGEAGGEGDGALEMVLAAEARGGRLLLSASLGEAAGGDQRARRCFRRLTDGAEGEVLRTNRRWRRRGGGAEG